MHYITFVGHIFCIIFGFRYLLCKSKGLSHYSQQTSLDSTEDGCNRGSGRFPPPLRVCTRVYTDVVQCSAVMQCLCLWSSKRSGTLYALCIRSVGVQWSQMLIEYAAGPEGENNKCLKHFSSKQCWTPHTLSPHAFCQDSCNQVPCISTTNLQVWHWDIGDFFLSLWSCWAGIAVYRIYWAWYCRPICNAKSFWLTSLSKKCVVGAKLIDKQNADIICNACKCR